MLVTISSKKETKKFFLKTNQAATRDISPVIGRLIFSIETELLYYSSWKTSLEIAALTAWVRETSICIRLT